MRFPRHLLFVPLLALLLLTGLTGCVQQGLVTQTYSDDFYKVPRTLPDRIEGDTASFLVVGDVQSGWRAERQFYRRHNWVTWKQLLFPLYQTYLLANGVTGAINYKRHDPDYGSQQRAMMRTALYNAARRDGADFWMVLGDMAADDGRRAKHWGQFLAEYQGLIRSLPLLPVLGNHEYSNDATYGGPNYEAIFDYDRFYVQDMPHASLFVLNSNYLIDQHELLDDDQQDALFEQWFVSSDPANPSWLERELAKRADQPFKMIAMHHPLLSYSWHSHDWHEAEHGRDLLEKRKKLIDLLARYNVQVALGGHEHVYEHNVLTHGQGRVMHQVISSGGGVPPRPEATSGEKEARQRQYEEQGYNVKSLVQRATYHYTSVQVTSDTLSLSTFEVSPSRPSEPRLLERIEIAAPPRVYAGARRVDIEHTALLPAGTQAPAAIEPPVLAIEPATADAIAMQGTAGAR